MLIKYFKNCETRYIYRNTNIYVQFLETSHHPDLLKNKYDFEVYLLRLFEYGDINNIFDRVMIKMKLDNLGEMIYQSSIQIHLVMKYIVIVNQVFIV